MNLKILSFNWHEPYLCLLSKLGHEFLIVEPEIAPGKLRKWDQNMRLVPNNISLIPMCKARKMLKLGELDLVIANNLKDLIEVKEFSLPKVSVFHNCLTTEIKLGQDKVNRREYLEKVEFLLNDVQSVFISEKKRNDWGLSGEVILPGLDIKEYGGYQGNEKIVLQVGNLLKERDLMMGYSLSKEIVGGHPLRTLGLNPNISSSKLSEGFEDLLENYRSCRLFINTTVDEFEDGYNLSMLEAMATGMPIVSTWNETSPILNGMNGFIARDTAVLNKRIEYLLKNPQEAKVLGENSRKTVQEKFPLTNFLQSWRQVIQKTIFEFLDRTGIVLQKKQNSFKDKARKNILMDFVSYPATTAHYLERAFRKKHNVITCGSQINDEIIKLWNLESLNWKITPQDIFRNNSIPLSQVISKLPEGWKPDFYLWVETGLSQVPEDLAASPLTKVCYLIDTHLHFDAHLEIAIKFDFVFLAQKNYVELMKKAGVNNVFWLPFGCDPEIHGNEDSHKKFDVGFIGTIPSTPDRRRNLLQRIEKRFDLNCQRKFMNEMAAHYGKSRIVFNNAVNNDLNMRVFEALCSGSLLVTDMAPGSGLSQIFKDKKHLIIYKDENLEEIISYYLENKSIREKIEAAGRKEVLEKHTYDHRVKELIQTLVENIKDSYEKENVTKNKKTHSYYSHIRNDLFPLIPDNSKYILEVGCANGLTGKELKKTYGAFVAGIELDPEAAKTAKNCIDDVIQGDIEKIDLPYSDNSFDCIIFADVLEHLVSPLEVLNKVHRILKNNGTIVASIPNVQFHSVINQLVEGNWTYEKEGILDETHLRFFTLREIEKLFKEAGFSLHTVEEVLDPQYEKFINESNGVLKVGRMQINKLTAEEMRRFFVFQYQISAKPDKVVKNEDKVMFKNCEELFKLDGLLLKASKEFDLGEFKNSLEIYDEALKLSPENTHALIGIGNNYMKLQFPDEAEKIFEQVCSIDPYNYEAWFGLGLLALCKKDISNADIYFNKSLENKPDNDKALSGLGLLRFSKDNLEGALECFDKALDANPDNISACKYLLEISYRLKTFDKVEIHICKYLELHPANVNMRFGLAGVQYMLGKLEDMVKNLEFILDLEPKHELALKMFESIKKDFV